MSSRDRVVPEYRPIWDTGKTTGLYTKDERGIFVMLKRPLVFAETGYGGGVFATVEDALAAIAKARVSDKLLGRT